MFVEKGGETYGNPLYTVYDKEGGKALGGVAVWDEATTGEEGTYVMFEAYSAAECYDFDVDEDYSLYAELSEAQVVEKAKELGWG